MELLENPGVIVVGSIDKFSLYEGGVFPRSYYGKAMR